MFEVASRVLIKVSARSYGKIGKVLGTLYNSIGEMFYELQGMDGSNDICFFSEKELVPYVPPPMDLTDNPE